jgi:predicted RNase H-like HicB family nuclease
VVCSGSDSTTGRQTRIGRSAAGVALVRYPEASGAEMKYAVLFEKTETGYSAHVPDLPGCVAAGATFEETASLMRKAIQMHLAGMQEDGEPIPAPRTIAEYIIAA